MWAQRITPKVKNATKAMVALGAADGYISAMDEKFGVFGSLFHITFSALFTPIAYPYGVIETTYNRFFGPTDETNVNERALKKFNGFGLEDYKEVEIRRRWMLVTGYKLRELDPVIVADSEGRVIDPYDKE